MWDAMNVSGVNKLVPCEPIQSLAVEKDIKGGFAFTKNKSDAYRIKVVFAAKGESRVYQPGDFVYVDGEQARGLPFTKKVYPVGEAPEVGAKDQRAYVILVPETAIIMHERLE